MKPVIISLAVVVACSLFLVSSFFFGPDKSEAIAQPANNATLTTNSTEEKSTLIADASQLIPLGNMDLSQAESTPTGLMYLETQSGEGATPERGQKVKVHYTGYLAKEGFQKGQKFDSSVDRNKPFVFTIDKQPMIAGFKEGILTMREGGKVRLFIPHYIGYGERANGPIPGKSDLVFELEVLKVTK